MEQGVAERNGSLHDVLHSLGGKAVVQGGGGRDRRGIKSGRYALVSGKFPRGCSYVARVLAELRRQLEAAVVAAHGQVSILHAASINSAVRHEGRAILAGRWLRLHAESMSHTERLHYLREVSNASDSRDRCLARLGLDKDDLLSRIFGQGNADDSPGRPFGLADGPLGDHGADER
jgi:hypothetical protein